MPLIKNSTYNYSGRWKNKHIQTLIPHIFRKVEYSYVRERISTPDNDFIDLDWGKVDSDRLCILLHGLEGSSDSTYVKGLARAINKRGLDIVVLNYRGQSGELNKLVSCYHSGKTDDIDVVLRHIITSSKYKSIQLVGLSIGGNLTLKYLGEKGSKISPLIKKAVVLGCPIDLESTSNHFDKKESRFYLKYFMNSWKKKLLQKAITFPDKIDKKKVKAIRNFWDLDNYYTGPFHGFKDAKEYYNEVSAINYLEKIAIPTLMITAENDPFLPKENYPIDIASKHDLLYLEITKDGGHLGFMEPKKEEYWSETRIADFVKRIL